MAQDKKKSKDKEKGKQKRRNPFSIFQGKKDAERLSNRSRREVEKATGRKQKQKKK